MAKVRFPNETKTYRSARNQLLKDWYPKLSY